MSEAVILPPYPALQSLVRGVYWLPTNRAQTVLAQGVQVIRVCL